jgi:NDP-sugar pyrophosphorylase family protein
MQVPIIDIKGKLQGIHTYHALLGYKKRPNWAVIMAGGKGTRLGTLTESIPKPMMKVAGKPILERIVLHLVGFGIENIFISINHLAHIIENYFGNGKEFGCKIQYPREEYPMGSGGALSLLPNISECPLILMNGDIVSDFDVASMLDFHEKGKYFATMAVSDYYHKIPYGCVTINSSNQLVMIQEKPIIEQKINTGIYVLSPAAVKSIPSNTFFPITNLFDNALVRHYSCGIYNVVSEWIDIGTPEDLQRARGAA